MRISAIGTAEEDLPRILVEWFESDRFVGEQQRAVFHARLQFSARKAAPGPRQGATSWNGR
jgi:hypothetical protein